MKKKIPVIVILLIVVSSVALLFNWFIETPIDVFEGETTEGILSEVDGNLLGEDDK
jgi:hypothetical protein